MKYLFVISCFFALNSFSQVDCTNMELDFTGYCNEYYANGQVKWSKQFENGRAIGVWFNFDEQGIYDKQLNTTDKKDSLNSVYKGLSAEVLYCGWAYEEASFIGGEQKMRQWIIENFVYPKEALERGVSGKCVIRFCIEKDGSISKVEVYRGVANCPECDSEAQRIIESMPKWRPAKHNSLPEVSYFQVPINFTLN